MSRQKINWECTYKKMPKKVKEFLTQLLGKEEVRKLMYAIRTDKFIVDENGLGMVIHTSQRLTDLKPIYDILEELGIGKKC